MILFKISGIPIKMILFKIGGIPIIMISKTFLYSGPIADHHHDHQTFLAAIAALYALMSVGLSVGLSVCLSVGRQQRVSRSVPRLINVKCGSGKFIRV